MKTLKSKFSICAILIIVLAFMSACDKDEGVVEPALDANSIQTESIENDEIPFLDNELLYNPQLVEASLETELSFIKDGIPSDEELDENEERKIRNPALRCLFDSLNLTDEQKAKLHYSMNEFRQCKLSHYVQLRKINQKIIKEGNIERLKLVAKFKNNEITKEQLYRALKALNEKVRNALRINNSRKHIIMMLKKCHKEFVENVRLILTKDQWAIWVTWHKKRLGNP